MLLCLVTEEDWLMSRMIWHTLFHFIREWSWQRQVCSLHIKLYNGFLIILGIIQSSSVTKRSSMSYINLHQSCSYNLHATTLLTDIFTIRYMVAYGVPMGYNKGCLWKFQAHWPTCLGYWGRCKKSKPKKDNKYGRDQEILLITFFHNCAFHGGRAATPETSHVIRVIPYGYWAHNICGQILFGLQP